MRKTPIIQILLAVFLSASLSAEEGATRGLKLLAAETVGNDVPIGKQWAVFIAIDDYSEQNPLQNPVRDAEELASILEANYFIDEAIKLYNGSATAAGIRSLFYDLRQDVGQNDSVFVYYAGHGYVDEATNTGSWLPVDAGVDQFEQNRWIPNSQIRSMLDALPARHVLLISDSCYSGDIMQVSRAAVPQFTNDYYRRAYAKISRQVISSGASENVPDSSEFSMRLKDFLLYQTSPCVDPMQIYTTVREIKTTQPLLGTLPSSRHQSEGSFLFFRKDAALAAAAETPSETSVPADGPAVEAVVKVINPIDGGVAGGKDDTDEEYVPARAPTVMPATMTAGKKIGFGFLNLAAGVGSFIQGDVTSGIILAAGAAATVGMFIYDGGSDIFNPFKKMYTYGGYLIGGAVVVYSFLQPFLYNRKPATPFVVVPLSTDKGLGLSISYKMKY
jgi:hypothetical protein